MSNSLTILGSASGHASAYRSCSGYCLTVEGRHIIFDCGGGITSSFLRAELDPLKIDLVFISHMHPDHHCDLPLLIQKIYLSGRTAPLTIYLPSEALETYRAYLTSCYLIFEKFPFQIILAPIEESVQLLQGQISINAIPNKHLSGYESLIERYSLPNRMQSFSFKITIENKIVFYSADVSSLEDIVSYLENLDLLIIETTHIELKELDNAIKNVRKIILSHIGDDKFADIKQFAESDGRNNRNGEYILAEDGLLLDI